MSHDLSGHLVRIDYAEMVKTAGFAVMHIRWAIEREQDNLREALDRREYPVETTTIVKAEHAAMRLKEYAEQLNIAVDTLMTLNAMESRPQYAIRNHPSEMKLCPICGDKIQLTGKVTENGRLIGSCGDAFFQFSWEHEAEEVDDET